MGKKGRKARIMSKTIVIYQSKYGATKKYAQWLSEKLHADLMPAKEASIEALKAYERIIFGGGIYATGIAGISFLKKHYPVLRNRVLLIFAVGASPYDEKALEALRERNLKDEMREIPLFYCRGAWNESAMSWKDRTLCNLLKKAVGKKDPTTYEPWEKALMEAIGASHDWTEEAQLAPILAYLGVN